MVCPLGGSSLRHTLPTHVGVGHEWTESTNTGCNQWLSLAKITLKVSPAGRNHSLVGNTNKCGEGINLVCPFVHRLPLNCDSIKNKILTCEHGSVSRAVDQTHMGMFNVRHGVVEICRRSLSKIWERGCWTIFNVVLIHSKSHIALTFWATPQPKKKMRSKDGL